MEDVGDLKALEAAEAIVRNDPDDEIAILMKDCQERFSKSGMLKEQSLQQKRSVNMSGEKGNSRHLHSHEQGSKTWNDQRLNKV